MLRDGLRILEVGLAGGGEFGGVVTRDACIVDEELDAFGLFLGDFVGEALAVAFVADVALETIGGC